jgi:CubicO group peptidase (beta-lactamase class C family)
MSAAARQAQVGPETVFPGDEWEERSPASVGVDASKLKAAVDFLEQHSGRDGVEELVVVRDGRLIWKGAQSHRVHGVWSCTKVFTSTALGLLIDDGKCQLDTRAREFVPVLSDRYPDASLRHFTTMTSGYRAAGDEPAGSYIHGPSRTPLLPAPEPLFSPPGSSYAYWDSAMNQFAHVLTRIAGEPLKALFQRRIAGPIGLSPEAWDWGQVGEADGLIVNGGAGNLDQHVRISARGLARLGLLYLNQGKWNGRTLISADWVKAATCCQVPASLPLKGAPIDGRGVYGYNWWMNGVGADGARKWPGAPVGAFGASGYNNNDMFLIPEWRMVIVRLGLDQDSREIMDTDYGRFLGMVGEAVHDR